MGYIAFFIIFLILVTEAEASRKEVAKFNHPYENPLLIETKVSETKYYENLDNIKMNIEKKYNLIFDEDREDN